MSSVADRLSWRRERKRGWVPWRHVSMNQHASGAGRPAAAGPSCSPSRRRDAPTDANAQAASALCSPVASRQLLLRCAAPGPACTCRPGSPVPPRGHTTHTGRAVRAPPRRRAAAPGAPLRSPCRQGACLAPARR
jgi:hypothetical protein